MVAMEIKRFTKTFRVCLLIVIMTCLCSVTSFPNGAPSYSCRNLIPGHSNGTQSSPPPYSVTLSNTVLEPGQSTTVSVTSTGDFPFLGFICAASGLGDPKNVAVGTVRHSSGFTEKDLLKPITCSKSDPNTAMTHTSRREKFGVQFEWAPPADVVPEQGFKMRCTVVQSFFRCWTGMEVNIFINRPPSTPHQGPGHLRDRGNGNNAAGPNNNNNINEGIKNVGISSLQESSTNNQLRSSSPTNLNENPALDFPLPQTLLNNPEPETGIQLPSQTDTRTSGFPNPSDIMSLLNLAPQNPSSSISFGNTLSPFQAPNEMSNIVPDPGLNEIPPQAQSIDLALLIDLINLGIITLRDGLISFDPIQTSAIDSNAINLGAGFNPRNNNPSPLIEIPHQNSRNFDFAENRQRSFRRGNSRGVFQSSNPRPFNPNFNRIRQPPPLNSNRI